MGLKILFLSHRFYPDIGGIEVNSEILANAFQKAGHHVRLVTWTEASGEKDFPFTVIRKPGLNRLLREHRMADVVFENNPCLRLAWPAVLFKKPAVVALRTWISRFDGKIAWQDKIKFTWLKRVNAIIAVSEAIKKECGMPAKVIGNPYRSEMFRILPEVERNLDFVFLGRLVSDKGAGMAIKAFHRLLNDAIAPECTASLSFTIIGDGVELEHLKKRVQELNIHERVNFTGNLRGEQLVTCLNRHRYLLVPSIWKEPFGNVALEGIACGCLPIVSDGGGLPDAVGDAGLVFKRGDDDELLSCMKKMIYDKETETELRKRAPEHLSAHLPEVVAGEYLKVITDAVHNFNSQ